MLYVYILKSEREAEREKLNKAFCLFDDKTSTRDERSRCIQKIGEKWKTIEKAKVF